MTTERTHLSIGEVLSLLQPEFPDITISKIRFLESQGLLDPERTPSGYRKFHDDDIERLRWILTQQRDHFLPLKVIKDRLASGDLGNGAPEGVLPLAADAAGGSESGGSVATVAPPQAPPAGSGPGTASDDDDGPRADAEPQTVAPSAGGNGNGAEPDDDHEPSAVASASTAAPAPGEPSGAGADRDAGEDASPVEPDPAAPTASEPEHGRAEAVGQLVEGPAEPEADAGSDEAGAAPTTGRRRHPTGHQPGEPTPEPGAEVEGEADEAAPRLLTLEELAERSGMSAREIGELERYGLIAAEPAEQGTAYDEECLVVARLAAGFNRYGIEPRHLRMYKVAAEREAGLFEQLISPLLKQRRPAARQQAVEMLEDLAELADDLRAAMVRSALREYLGGS